MRVPASPEQLRRLESIHSVRSLGSAGVRRRMLVCALCTWGWLMGGARQDTVCLLGTYLHPATAPAGTYSMRLGRIRSRDVLMHEELGVEWECVWDTVTVAP